MAKLPYYPMLVDDFDQDDKVKAMSLAEIGLFTLCLNESWRAGSLPDDVEQLAVDIRRRPSDIELSWPRVRACYRANSVGRLVNSKQEIVRVDVEKKSLAAKKSAETRWAKDRKKETGGDPPTSLQPVTGGDPPTSAAVCEPAYANASKNGCESNARAFGLVCSSAVLSFSSSKQISRFVDEYPRAVDDEGAREYLSLMESAEHERVLFENLAAWKASDQWQRGIVPGAANWLKKGTWKVKPKKLAVLQANGKPGKLDATLDWIMNGDQ